MSSTCFCSPAIVDARAVDQAPALIRLEALEHVRVQPRERFRLRRGDLLDLDAALGREHEERRLLRPVERDGEVVLLRDVGRALDPELAHDVAADVEPENRARLLLGVRRVVRELHAAGLASPAGEHLRLDDDRPAELHRRGARLLRRGREPAVRDGDAEAAKELLPLVLVEIHRPRRV